VELDLTSKAVCPHCDAAMILKYFGGSLDLKYLCAEGCKAEYGVILAIGPTATLPVCGAKRVQTHGR
jgi:hypothetical protein